MNRFLLLLAGIAFCQLSIAQTNKTYPWQTFVMGSDLSYVNQIEDAGGVYKANQEPQDVFSIFKQLGNNTVRVRLWRKPNWIAPLNATGKLYSDIEDVVKTMRRAKEAGMAVCLDLHYADDWCDPNQQPTPADWKNLPLHILKDSVYNYTLQTLQYLQQKNLVPEMIQVGNENNFGMLWPIGKIDTSSSIEQQKQQWKNFGVLLQSGIKAVRNFSKTSPIKPQIILHVAQLQFAHWWLTHLQQDAGIKDFDILGLSHYYKWSTVNTMQAIGDTIRLLHKKLHQRIMIVETAFPFTNKNADQYNNLFYATSPIEGYAFTPADQIRYMQDLIKTLMQNGGSGMMYWEPAWITSPMKDRWGQGSSWENNAFFDFDGNLLPNLHFMQKLPIYPIK